ncbi:MAG TPA: cytochrome c nitrite reductase small subunit [Longimicrobium sp.]
MRRRVAAALAAGCIIGAAAGLGAFTFVYARGASYLTNDPGACANCHVMREHFSAWQRSSHHNVAVCNDCHAPHNLAGKYYTKGLNGFWHSFYFTSGTYPYPLRMTARNRRVTEGACRHCHEEITDAIEHGAGGRAPDGVGGTEERLACTRCHSDVGHWVR